MTDDSHTVIGPLAYQGKKGCRSVICTRTTFATERGMCFGWHCSYCDAPCSSQGHGCDAAKAILGEALRAATPDAEEGNG